MKPRRLPSLSMPRSTAAWEPRRSPDPHRSTRAARSRSKPQGHLRWRLGQARVRISGTSAPASRNRESKGLRDNCWCDWKPPRPTTAERQQERADRSATGVSGPPELETIGVAPMSTSSAPPQVAVDDSVSGRRVVDRRSRPGPATKESAGLARHRNVRCARRICSAKSPCAESSMASAARACR